jgi:alanine dehydrogenase
MIPFPFFTEEDVIRQLRMPAVIEQVQEAFRALARGEAANLPRFRVPGKGIVLHCMAATADYLGVVGTKQYTTTRRGAQFHISLYDQATGRLLALLEGNRLGQQRTGAVTAVAARHLTPPDIDRLGLFGAGWQAESQLEAVAVVRPIREVRVFSRSPDRRQEFARRMASRLGIAVVPVERPEDAARGLPLVITATNAQSPVLEASWLDATACVAAIGSNWPRNAEVAAEVIERADRIVCDDVECCRVEAGDLLEAERQGKFSWDRAVGLAGIVAREDIEPLSSAGRVFFKSVGMALEDLAVAHALWCRVPTNSP